MSEFKGVDFYMSTKNFREGLLKYVCVCVCVHMYVRQNKLPYILMSKILQHDEVS